MDGDGFFIRMAEPCDAGAVDASFRSAVPRLRASFGFVDFSSLIEHSLYPLIGLSDDDEVIAFAAFNDTPSVPGGVSGKRALDSKVWAAKEASAHGYHPENSLWIEVCVASLISPEAQEKYLKQFLSALFKLSPETRVVLDLSPFEHANSRGILRPISRSQDMDLVLLMCLQSTVLPSINIKQAIVENYDDLFPIVENAQNKGSPLSNIPNAAAPAYPFAMARLIAAQDAKNNVLAAEIDGKLVGVIAVTHELDSKYFSGSKQGVSTCLATTEVGQEDPRNKIQRLDLRSNETNEDESALIESPVHMDVSQEENATLDNDEIPMQSLCQNAFQITMFCLEEEFNHRALDFLAAAFVFEGKENCIVQLPYNCPPPDFLQYFTSITRKECTSETAEDQDVLLYVLHRRSIANGFEVRLAAPQDVGSIWDLLRGSETFANMRPWVERPTKGCTALVASCRAEVVGVALVDTNCPANALISHFDLRQLTNIDQHQENCQAVLTLFFLKPFFANRQRLFLREIMRQITKTIIFLPVFQGQNVSNMLEDMVLVPGRWHSSMIPPCSWTQLSPNSRSSFRGSVQQYTTNTATGQYVGFDCALFMMTHRLLSRKRTLVNSRIVVVGASQAAAACLNKMITCTNLKFSNLTLISPFGLKSLCDSSKTLLDVELGPANAFQKMGIDCLVKVVTDTVIDFDKKAKCIQLMSGKKLQYDYLILTVGLQDQTRAKIQADSNKGVVNLDELSIMLNENALSVSKWELPVVIYGLSLQTFCSIHLLLSKGVPGSSMVVVYPEFEPLDSFAEQCFQDGFIAASLMKEIRAAGVIERSGFKLLEVTPGEKEGFLQAVGLEKIFRASLSSLNQINDGGICIKQPCKLLVACTQPHVDQTLFRAIRKEALVFNGRIVVDGNFQTNDPSIFACGSSAMFSRQCGKHLIHELFNSYELGQSLAKSIISLFTDYLPSHDKLWGGLLPDPFETLPPARPVQMWPKTSIPRLVLAKGVSALLPGNFVYFKVKNATLQSSYNQDKPMQPLIVKKDEWLLKVEWTEGKELGAITYWGKANLEAWKFIRLAGCHDPLISNLSLGNSKAMMNISSFFAQPWFILIFHDKFLDFYSELCLDVYQILTNAPESQNVVQDVVKDAYITFLTAYKADFPGLNFSSSWFLSKSDQHPWRGMLGVSKSTGISHSKARLRKQDDVVKDNEWVDVVSINSGQKVSVSKDEVKASSQMNKDIAERSEERKLFVQQELVSVVERIVEQIVRAQLKISSVEAGGSKQLSVKEEIELVVENIVKNLVNSEAMNASAKGILEGVNVESSIEVEVELVVRQIVEKLAGQQAVDKNGSPIVRVRLTFVKNAEGGVLVEKTQVKLLVEDEFSSTNIGLSHCLDASKILEEDQHVVNVRLLVASGADDDNKLVKVQFEYPQNDHVIATRLSSVTAEERSVKLILNFGSATGDEKLVKVQFEHPQNDPIIPRLSSSVEKIVKLILDCGREGSIVAKLIPNE